MRGFLAFLFIAFVGLGAGALGYQAGTASVATTAAAACAGTVVYAGGWHLGWLLLFPFGLFLFPLFLITFFGFLSFVFGGHRRRWADHGQVGMHGGSGFGPRGFGPMGGHGPFGRDRFDARREWVAEAHRHLHEEEAARAAGSSPASTTSTSASAPSAPSAGPADAGPR